MNIDDQKILGLASSNSETGLKQIEEISSPKITSNNVDKSEECLSRAVQSSSINSFSSVLSGSDKVLSNKGEKIENI